MALPTTQLSQRQPDQEPVRVKVLTPLKSSVGKNGLLTDREEEEKNRETAILFQDGIRTNLIGRMYSRWYSL